MDGMTFTIIIVTVATISGMIFFKTGYSNAFIPENKPRMDCIASKGIWEKDACWKIENGE